MFRPAAPEEVAEPVKKSVAILAVEVAIREWTVVVPVIWVSPWTEKIFPGVEVAMPTAPKMAV